MVAASCEDDNLDDAIESRRQKLRSMTKDEKIALLTSHHCCSDANPSVKLSKESSDRLNEWLDIVLDIGTLSACFKQEHDKDSKHVYSTMLNASKVWNFQTLAFQ